jgi:glycosyltransferase involved in cell wall biosynthesis
MIPSSPLVSIILPAYNAAEVIEDAIASVQQQTFKNWRLWVIDDGSTDETAAIVQRMQQQDLRIRLIQQINRGVSAARNHGVVQSRSPYIAFLDADDQWLPHTLNAHLQHFMDSPNLGVSFGRVEILTSEGKATGQISTARLTHLQAKHFLAENPTTTPSTWMIRREVWKQVGGFSEEMSFSEDLAWLLRVCCTTQWKIEGIDAVLTRYRTSAGGLSADLYRMEAGWKQLVEHTKRYAPDFVTQQFAQAQAIHLRYLARRAIRLNLPAQVGFDFMSRALRSDWLLPLRQPRRTVLTMIAVYGRWFLASLRERWERVMRCRPHPQPLSYACRHADANARRGEHGNGHTFLAKVIARRMTIATHAGTPSPYQGEGGGGVSQD